MAEAKTKRFSRRSVTLFWCLMIAVGVTALLVFKQIAALYVLATLGLVILLAIVGWTNLDSTTKRVEDIK